MFCFALRKSRTITYGIHTYLGLVSTQTLKSCICTRIQGNSGTYLPIVLKWDCYVFVWTGSNKSNNKYFIIIFRVFTSR